jgi:beta-xylosidase
MKLYFLPIRIVIIWSTFTTLASAQGFYINPVGGISNIGDPSVLKYNGVYYLYATSEVNRGFLVWTSVDLVHWSNKGLAYDSNMPANSGFGTADFWAPSVIFYDGQFLMFFSARTSSGHLQIGLAVSNNPLGPFVNCECPFLNLPGSYIDPQPFIDDDGTPYLYYVKDCSENIVNGVHMSQIYVQALAPHTLYPVGDPVLCIQPSQQWEGLNNSYQWNEGPFVLKHFGSYYLTYSANYFASVDYAVGYAVASSPLGPWQKYYNNPILQKNLSIGVGGPGGNCVTTSPDGTEYFIVYHALANPERPSGDRTLNIDRMVFRSDGSIEVNGPTRSPQPMPSGSTSTFINEHKSQLDRAAFTLIYPNPFNSSSMLSFRLKDYSFVQVSVFDILGRKVKELISQYLAPGTHDVMWNGTDEIGMNVPDGIYLFVLYLNGRMTSLQKVIVLK